MTDLFLKAHKHWEQKLPFVLYTKPNNDKCIGLFQENATLYLTDQFDEKGFVFAPFQGKGIPYIPLDVSDVYVAKKSKEDFFLSKNQETNTSPSDKVFFENLVALGVSSIMSGNFQKVVLSRKEELEVQSLDWKIVLARMMMLYPNAFTYCFFHPKIGMWLGATPEQFLKIAGNTLSTVALAGTRNVQTVPAFEWPMKEREEQQMVTDFIVNQLHPFVKEVKVSVPYTANAGAIEHIKTDISATLHATSSIASIIASLHPTSAVCGLPKAEATAFILQHEGYDREYYSGFLGEMNVDLQTFQTDQTDLFVNLRCMKVQPDRAAIYVGCGITASSIPEKEYEETVHKSLTMKRVL